MKRFLSVALSAALLCGGLAVTGVSAEDTAKVRPTVTLAESGFEDGLKAPFIINDGQAVGTQVSLEGDECSFPSAPTAVPAGAGRCAPMDPLCRSRV